MSAVTHRAAITAAKRIAFLLLLCFAPAALHAETGGPDYWAVSGVKQSSGLAIHVKPSVKSPLAGKAPYDARGLRNLGCKDKASFSDWLKLHGAARRAAGRNRWCHIRYHGIEGWVRGRYLVEDSPAK
jgi:hypothetical protein